MRGRIEQYCDVKQEVILVLKESPLVEGACLASLFG